MARVILARSVTIYDILAKSNKNLSLILKMKVKVKKKDYLSHKIKIV